MPYRVKRGVVLVVSAPVEKLTEFLERATARTGLPFYWITGGVEGAHGETSLHYEARALDIRDRDWTPAQRATILQRLAASRQQNPALHFLPETDHLHVEWRETR